MHKIFIIQLLLTLPALAGLPEELYFSFLSPQSRPSIRSSQFHKADIPACTVPVTRDKSQKNAAQMTLYKTIRVQEAVFPSPAPSAARIDSMFDAQQIEFHPVDTENWPGFEYRPRVKFRIAYSQDEIYLQYRVEETCIKAVYGKDAGSAPYKDSCVEFFIIPGEDSTYYNLEMNCIGKGTFAGGARRTERTRFTDHVLRQIRRTSTLGNLPFGIKKIEEEPGNSAEAAAGYYRWQLTVALPLSLFSLSPVPPLKGRTVRANFYKCGDDMPQRHYLSWNPVGTPRPNFHTPEYFGYLYFE